MTHGNNPPAPATCPANVAPPTSASGPSLQLLRSRALWLLLAAVALEFFLFDQLGARRFTNHYPRWNDQIQYLGESYHAFEHARTHGFASALWQSLVNRSAQGTLHDAAALIAFKLAGPSRSAALALNLLALAAWQLSLFFAVARASSRPALGFAAAFLPLALLGPWQDIPGSAYDFRLDHLAMCALGVTASAAWLSDGFRSRRHSLLFGVAVSITLLTRFLTGTYFVLIFAAAAAWVLSCTVRRTRLTNLTLVATVAFALSAPIFWINLETVRDYYWIGHYIGPESTIRDSRLSFLGSLQFLGTQLYERHLGAFVVVLAVAGALVLAFLRAPSSIASATPSVSSRPSCRQGWIVGALFLFSPALILALHRQKSEVVVGALAPGVLVVVAAAWLLAARRARPAQLRVFAAAVAICALVFFFRTQARPAYSPHTLAQFRLVNSLADEIHRRTHAAPLREPRIAVDYITDALDAQVLRIVFFERHRDWHAVNMTLPTGIAEPDEATVLSRLAESDFVFLTVAAPDGPVSLRSQARRPPPETPRVVRHPSSCGQRTPPFRPPHAPLPAPRTSLPLIRSTLLRA